jgi:2-polyprenyl-3-methyl-5-hydroxy-6-metoxy-1,4-benzoquinol methylase
MNVRQAYNVWASQYDTNDNKTRDLEAKSLREILHAINVDRCLEIGCGTGKNTQWLVEKAKHVTAVDLSEEMLAKAKARINSDRVTFRQADLATEWVFAEGLYNLVVFSLVLEHIEHLEPVVEKVAHVLQPGGYMYIGELHPFKQYSGSKARFDTEAGTHIVSCFNHNVSDFIQAARNHGLTVTNLNEYFDQDDRTSIPRILTILFQKT